MPSYNAPVRDTRFVINELLDLSSYADLPGFEAVTPELVDTLVEEAGKFAGEVLAPLNMIGDKEGCTRHPDGRVTTPPGFREAYNQFREAGWGAISMPTEFGGQGLPHVLNFVVEEFVDAANIGFGLYPGLAMGAVAALANAGTQEQQQTYLPRLVSGEWLGTMNLTEAHCGTDLGLIRTKAVPQDDGSYAISGTKIFISSGEHDLTENIIHLVLAKMPDAPEGTKGISLFVVPKILVNADGSLGERNTLSCGAIEEKMGLHGSATCVMNYDGAKGWLVGQENRGLAAMFVMMNAARLGVGIQGLGQAETAFQNGANYARERRQGRALTGPADPGQPADPIIVHPDVRRMLMNAKALTEGLRALALWSGLQVDLAHKAKTAEERQAADDLIGLLTPIVKGYTTEKAFEVTVAMQQVYGGHGYITEWGMEQFVRDARIPMIYEGTNGVQAMDLCGRKLAKDGGRAIQAFFQLVDEDIAAAKDDAQLSEIAAKLAKAVGEQKAATMWFLQNGMTNPNNVGAGAFNYLSLMGIVCVGLMWLRMARVAARKLAEGAEDKAFYEAKLVTARYFADRMMPEAGALRHMIEGGSDAMMALPADAFGAVS
ncbi:acyl-CoA dehydrogenase C-terminal domain-containing protein [Caenibius sp. WL]|uniref:acyl-CoA dehydrogenase C-terminal domain-containing protein n=1 Tax=Caenibius sp. WL TaxID=2872646 RepID=UPI001C99EE3B|nr:acyl-CoA dehydrogenase C-terminal domain-containing protein [Caenibius sp. WL]QZP09863.1 acyl-CoA dehydrogenase C-terminal domain-containing protein [Caenibius sp. WL]